MLCEETNCLKALHPIHTQKVIQLKCHRRESGDNDTRTAARQNAERSDYEHLLRQLWQAAIIQGP